MRGEEKVLLEFRQLVGAEQRFVAHQERHLHFRVTMLGGVQVEHELADGAFQPRQPALSTVKRAPDSARRARSP